jgi:ceramide glucosyltransferase
MFGAILLVLILASWCYWLAALILVYDFFRPRPDRVPDFAPPVSVLKPVKGADFEAYENFASFCQQDYPDYEVLFGVADASDPIIPVIERLRHDFPDRQIRLVVAAAWGSNRKASLLQHLAEAAEHAVIVVSDSDMRVTPAYLKRVVAPLADPQVGLVTCPYQGRRAMTLTARLEALHMGVTFLPSVIVARKVLNMRFAMGATVALRRHELARIGGFAALSDYLADDYQLGARVAALGLKVRLSDYAVSCILGATTFAEQWAREVRWMRCSRVSRPLEYPGLLLSFSTPLSALLVVIDGAGQTNLRVLLVSLLLRWAVAWLVSLRTGDHEVRRWLYWLPVRDLLSAATWLVGGFGRRISWRGETFVLQADGRMQVATPPVEEKRYRRLRWL